MKKAYPIPADTAAWQALAANPANSAWVSAGRLATNEPRLLMAADLLPSVSWTA